MNKNAKIIIAILLFSNLLLIGLFFLGKSQRPQFEGPRQLIIEKLEFDEKQVNQFDKLIEVHKERMSNTHERIARTKKELYKSLTMEKPQLNDSLTEQIANGIKEIEEFNFTHFMEIKGLCKEEQKVKFNQLAEKLGMIFQPKRPGHEK